jgi:two-component system sensor histidine kinase UhpB
MLRLLGSLRGLRVQLLLWLVLPLTLALVTAALISTALHQRLMRQMVEELDARSARLAATRLSDRLAERVTWLELMAASRDLTLGEVAEPLFDGGLARFDASGQLMDAFPSLEAWRARPLAELLATRQPGVETESNQAIFSPLFLDRLSNRDSLLIGLLSTDKEGVAGVVSLERLGLTEIVAQAKTTSVPALAKPHPEIALGDNPNLAADNAVAFLVDATGRVIHHPDPALIGQDLKAHEGVVAVIQGQAGATYHREPDGQELAVGYAPVTGPGWGLIVQEPWADLIAPTARLSLLVPLTLVGVALISGLAVTFGLRYVVRPLQTLDRQATRVAWGDFAAVSEPVGGVQEIEDLRHTLAGMAAQIRDYQSGMRDYVAAVTMAQEEERKRLARELHDETVQALIALGQRIEMAQKALDKDPEKARQRLVELSALARETQEEVRRFSRALRPLYLEDLGFVPALEMLAQEVERQHGLAVSVQTEGVLRRLAPDLELAAYRIAQEGLSNVVRHAQAKTACLNVTFTEAELILRIKDDGRGFEPPLNPAELAHNGHFGLMGIRERALLFGGRLEARSRPGAGTTLTVFLPLGQKD